MYKLHGWCFGEDQCRIIISTNNPKEIINLSKNDNIEVLNLGKTDNTGHIKLGKYDGFFNKRML